MIRVGLIASTGGAVYRECCRRSPYLRERISHVIVDRPCGALDVAKEYGHANTVLPWVGRRDFSSRVLSRLQKERIGIAFSFFTRILGAPLLDAYAGRLLNFHPSLLPACPGMRGFEMTLHSGALFVGSTVHLVDSGVDTGLPVLQACFPRAPQFTKEQLRHRIFMQQCKSLIQVVRWYEDGRVKVMQDVVRIAGSSYEIGEFSPALDDDEAITLFND